MWRDSQPLAVGERSCRRRIKHHPLFAESPQQSVRHTRDFVATKHSHDRIDLGQFFEQRLASSLGKTARHDHAAHVAAAFQFEHLFDRGTRLVASFFDETAGVDDDKVGTNRLMHEAIPIELQQPQHPLAVDEVLGAAETDERVRSLNGHVAGSGRFRGRRPARLIDDIQIGRHGLCIHG